MKEKAKGKLLTKSDYGSIIFIDNHYSQIAVIMNNVQNILRFQQMIESLKSHGFRLTPQRLALVALLADTTTHPTANQLYEQLRTRFPTMSRATVYKTLSTLKELGEIQELSTGDGEARYDGYQAEPHPHLMCVQCKRIIDYPMEEWPAALIAEIETASGFQILGYEMVFYGVCPVCRAAGRQTQSSDSSSFDTSTN